MSDHPVPGGPHLTRSAPAPARGVLWPVVAVSVVLALAGGTGVAIAAVQPGWAITLCVAVVVVAGLAVLVTALRVKAAPPPPPAYQPPPPQSLPPEPVAVFGTEPGQRRDVFGKLAQRLQGLINRAISAVDDQERSIEDPEQLKGLYEIDHLITRMRRQAENLAVLGGGALQRRSKTPVDAYAVLRSAVAEIEHYKQVTIMPIEHVQVHGHVVAEVIHLLAELLENATTWTAPDAPKVVLRAHRVTAGLAVVVQDRGLGMPRADQERINQLLDGSADLDLAELLQDGRIGLGVVKELARRHGIRVRLEDNIFGGIDAAVVLPHELLSEQRTEEAEENWETAALPAPVPAVEQSRPGIGAPVPVLAGRHEAPAEGHLPVRDPGSSFLPSPTPRQQPVSAPEPPPWQQQTPEPEATQWQIPEPEATQWQAPEPEPLRYQGAAESDSPDQLPPLPQRRATASHLRPELREAPVRPTVVPGHNPNLIGAARLGLERSQEPDPAPSQSDSEQGGSTAWPTT